MTDDPYRDFMEYDARVNEWLNSRPICSECGQPIQEEECYKIGKDLYCLDCMESFLVYTEDLV